MEMEAVGQWRSPGGVDRGAPPRRRCDRLPARARGRARAASPRGHELHGARSAPTSTEFRPRTRRSRRRSQSKCGPRAPRSEHVREPGGLQCPLQHEDQARSLDTAAPRKAPEAFAVRREGRRGASTPAWRSTSLSEDPASDGRCQRFMSHSRSSQRVYLEETLIINQRSQSVPCIGPFQHPPTLRRVILVRSHEE